MTDKRLNIEDFLTNAAKGVILDVRSESEYASGHIPGAESLPLFNDAERAEVGTLYVKVGKEQAIERGLEIVGIKMADMVRRAKVLSGGRTVYIYCWRGGMRSGSVGWLLRTAGLKAEVLEGGYKAYRRSFVDILAPFKDKIIVLSGPTGAGKTEMLELIERMGEQVLDLEGLASHRGSAFGGIGMRSQPSTEMFGNLIHSFFRNADPSKRVWCEGESVAIGRVFIPDIFFNMMQEGRFVYVDMPIELRVPRLVKDYGALPMEMLRDAFLRISKRLGGDRTKTAIDALEHGDTATAARIALEYYDKGYSQSINQMTKGIAIRVTIEEDSPYNNALKIIKAV